MSNIALIYTAETVIGCISNSYYNRVFTKRYSGGAFTCYYTTNEYTTIFLASLNKNAARVHREDLQNPSSTINLEPVAYEYNNKT